MGPCPGTKEPDQMPSNPGRESGVFCSCLKGGCCSISIRNLTELLRREMVWLPGRRAVMGRDFAILFASIDSVSRNN